MKIVTHEDCHKYYAYYFFGHNKDGICVTAEGIGDYSNGSVSTINFVYCLNNVFIRNSVEIINLTS